MLPIAQIWKKAQNITLFINRQTDAVVKNITPANMSRR